MPEFRFTDTQARVYVDRALVVEPGDVVDWPDGAPDDGQWQPLGQADQDGDADGAMGETETEDQAPPAAAPKTEE